MALSRQRPDTRGTYALDVLREDLVEGRLEPGKHLAADELASQLGVSHIPVREALRFLEAQGLLERDDRGRVAVPPLVLSDAEEIYGLRRELEDEAHRRAVPNLTGDDLDRLDVAFEAMQSAEASEDRPAYARANRAFHFVPFERDGGHWRLRFLALLWDAAARYQAALLAAGRADTRDVLAAQHAELLAAFRRRSVDDVLRLTSEHREVTIAATRSWIDVDGAPEARVTRLSYHPK
jgi:DNA-binding GntR family transcriptional regulator